VNARIRNSCRLNIGWTTLVSTTQKIARTTTPTMRQPSTNGLVQPSAWLP
jgi:hypothetical protein